MVAMAVREEREAEVVLGVEGAMVGMVPMVELVRMAVMGVMGVMVEMGGMEETLVMVAKPAGEAIASYRPVILNS